MDGKKKLAGWLVLTVIALVAAVALATTNLMTEKPIAEQNLGENQQAMKAMFPEADEFAELSPGESSGVSFVYEVKQGGQTIGYAVKETVQGYGGSIEVLTGMETGGTLRGISVGGPDFKETEGLGARAKEPEFTDQFAGKTPPLKLGENIDGISGATVTSRAVVDGVNQGVGKVQSLTGGETGGAAETEQPAREANASVIGYGGPVLVRVRLNADGAIESLNVGEARFAETDGVGSKVKDESFIRQFVGKTPPLELGKDIDGISGATVSSQAVVDAVNQAAEFLGK
mgnify:FL=1